MTLYSRISRAIGRFGRADDGSTLMEVAIVVPAFMLIYFGLIDFGRYSFHLVTSERAIHVAARLAAVRPPACAGVATVNRLGPLDNNITPPRFGTNCSALANLCSDPGDVSCTGSGESATATEIWALIEDALPPATTIGDLTFTYTHDANLGFLGGPYVPRVTVTLAASDFTFVSPLGTLVALTGSQTQTAPGSTLAFPSISVSLPAEDMARGNLG